MLENIPSGRGGGLSNIGCWVWIISFLILGFLLIFAMKYFSDYGDNIAESMLKGKTEQR
jgi:hypothetical protein